MKTFVIHIIIVPILIVSSEMPLQTIQNNV